MFYVFFPSLFHIFLGLALLSTLQFLLKPACLLVLPTESQHYFLPQARPQQLLVFPLSGFLLALHLMLLLRQLIFPFQRYLLNRLFLRLLPLSFLALFAPLLLRFLLIQQALIHHLVFRLLFLQQSLVFLLPFFQRKKLF